MQEPDSLAPRVFPVDINRAEFVRYNLYMARERRLYRFRSVMLAAFGLIFAAAAASVVLDLLSRRPLNTSSLTLMVFVLICGAVMLFGVPNYIRIKAGHAFDRSLMAGREYYGVVKLYPNRIEKTAGGKTVSIPFADAGFAEYDDMMVIVSPETPAIVLPARCVVEEDAAAVREYALRQIPAVRQRRYARMVSKTTTRLELPPNTEPQSESDETLMVVPVSYTPDEFLRVITRSALNVYLGRLPLCAGVSLIAALALGFSRGPFVMSLIFLSGLAILFIIHVVIPRVRTRLQLPALSADALVMRLVLTEKGVRINGNGRSTLFYPWLAVTRVSHQGQWIVFHFNQAVIEVPERCVPDLDALEDILQTFLHRSNGSGVSSDGTGGGGY